MYTIIGADGRQYGPVGPEQIRRWLAEDRLRADSLARAEGSTEWKPLRTFAEFAAELSTPPPFAGPSPAVAAGSDPRAANKIPAGICGILLGSFGIHKFILGYTGAGLIMLLVTILTCGWGGIVMHLIGLIEGIIYLARSDEEFVRTYVVGRKEWF